MTIVGTRPEVIRLSRVIDRFDRYCEHTLVHTGQNHDYELNEVFFQDLGIRKAGCPSSNARRRDGRPRSSERSSIVRADLGIERYRRGAAESWANTTAAWRDRRRNGAGSGLAQGGRQPLLSISRVRRRINRRNHRTTWPTSTVALQRPRRRNPCCLGRAAPDQGLKYRRRRSAR
jgi:hypothetical protein